MPFETVISKIILKNSSQTSKIPALSSLDFGELGINTVDGKIFAKTTSNVIKTFLNSDDQYFVFNKDLSAVTPIFGDNDVTQVFSSIFGGYGNNITGGGSSVINGENNNIDSDFSLIGNGLNNKISLSGDYSFIAGGQNNRIQHFNVFTLGSNLTSHAENFTYVNNLSANGKLYGDGSQLTGIAVGNTEITTLVNSNSGNWNSSYTTIRSNSATTWNYQGTDVKSLTGNWQNTFTTVQSNSATTWTKSKTIAFFSALNNEPPATNFATLDTRNSHPVLDFDTTTQEAAIFRCVVIEGVNLSNGLNVITQWAATSATSGTIGWDVAFERIASNGIDIDADSFGTARTITAITVPSTSGVTLTSSCSFTQAQLPSGLTNGDMYRMRIRRDVANDTASGDAELLGVEVRLI